MGDAQGETLCGPPVKEEAVVEADSSEAPLHANDCDESMLIWRRL
jgi:hypothetical protein